MEPQDQSTGVKVLQFFSFWVKTFPKPPSKRPKLGKDEAGAKRWNVYDMTRSKAHKGGLAFADELKRLFNLNLIFCDAEIQSDDQHDTGQIKVSWKFEFPSTENEEKLKHYCKEFFAASRVFTNTGMASMTIGPLDPDERDRLILRLRRDNEEYASKIEVQEGLLKKLDQQNRLLDSELKATDSELKAAKAQLEVAKTRINNLESNLEDLVTEFRKYRLAHV